MEIAAIVGDWRAVVVWGFKSGFLLWEACCIPSILDNSSTWVEMPKARPGKARVACSHPSLGVVPPVNGDEDLEGEDLLHPPPEGAGVGQSGQESLGTTEEVQLAMTGYGGKRHK
jgi:hypothetical protein